MGKMFLGKREGLLRILCAGSCAGAVLGGGRCRAGPRRGGAERRGGRWVGMDPSLSELSALLPPEALSPSAGSVFADGVFAEEAEEAAGAALAEVGARVVLPEASPVGLAVARHLEECREARVRGEVEVDLAAEVLDGRGRAGVDRDDALGLRVVYEAEREGAAQGQAAYERVRLATEAGRREAVAEAVARGDAGANARVPAGAGGTLLFQAARDGDEEGVRGLLGVLLGHSEGRGKGGKSGKGGKGGGGGGRRAAVDVGDEEGGHSPLSAAARGGHVGCVAALLEAGADADGRDAGPMGRTPMFWALMEGHDDVVAALVAGGADVNAPACIDRGWSPAYVAAAWGCDVALAALMAAGADVAAPDARGWTPLMAAAGVPGNEAAVRVLAGALDARGINAANGYGWTALHVAARNRCRGALGALLAAGADMEAVDARGRTPVEVAVHAGSVEEVVMLADAGAEVGRTDAFGRSLVDAAVDMGWDGVADALRARGLSAVLGAGATEREEAKASEDSAAAAWAETMRPKTPAEVVAHFRAAFADQGRGARLGGEGEAADEEEAQRDESLYWMMRDEEEKVRSERLAALERESKRKGPAGLDEGFLAQMAKMASGGGGSGTKGSKKGKGKGKGKR